MDEPGTTDDVLRSTVADLEDRNHRLQARIEELCSANAELQAINRELRVRAEELNEVNAFMESILMSLRGGIAVLDRTLTVQVWNPQAEQLWGIDATEAEQTPLPDLDVGLPVAPLAKALVRFLAGEPVPTTIEIDAVNRRDQAIRCQISASPLFGTGGIIEGVVVVMERLDPADDGCQG